MNSLNTLNKSELLEKCKELGFTKYKEENKEKSLIKENQIKKVRKVRITNKQ